MSAKELFEKIRSERIEIEELSDQIERIENIAGVKAIVPQPVIVRTNKIGSSLESAAIEAVELKNQLSERREKLIKDILKAEQIVSRIRRSEYRRVITAYYITGPTRRRMDEVARDIPCSESTAWRCLRKGMRAAEEIYLKVGSM